MQLVVRPSTEDDRDWMAAILIDNWASNIIVTRGIPHEAERLPAIVAEMDGNRIGLLTYTIKEQDLEIITMNAIERGRGVGTALLGEVESIARRNGCSRIWLITTNDNTDAIRFYQIRGFELVAVHRHAIEESRKIKPQLPLIGNYNIPIRDEIEMEMYLRKK